MCMVRAERPLARNGLRFVLSAQYGRAAFLRRRSSAGMPLSSASHLELPMRRRRSPLRGCHFRFYLRFRLAALALVILLTVLNGILAVPIF